MEFCQNLLPLLLTKQKTNPNGGMLYRITGLYSSKIQIMEHKDSLRNHSRLKETYKKAWQQNTMSNPRMLLEPKAFSSLSLSPPSLTSPSSSSLLLFCSKGYYRRYGKWIQFIVYTIVSILISQFWSLYCCPRGNVLIHRIYTVRYLREKRA